MAKIVWEIEEIKNGQFSFVQKIDGSVNQSLYAGEREKAAVYAAAIIQGYQPPRCLHRLDKPSG